MVTQKIQGIIRVENPIKDGYSLNMIMGIESLEIEDDHKRTKINNKVVMHLNNKRKKDQMDVYKPNDFALGDFVWAKCGKSFFCGGQWLQAPESVHSCSIPGVMSYRYSKSS